MQTIRTMAEANTLLDNVNKPVVFYFTGPNCSACKQFKPVVARLSETLTTAHFAEVDVSTIPNLASKYSVRQLPTTVVVRYGVVNGVKAGSVSIVEFVKFLAAAGIE